MKEPKTPGRKPTGKKAMTAAEKKRAQRQREKESGHTQISLALETRHSETISNLGKITGMTKSEILRMLILFGLKEAGALKPEEQSYLKIVTTQKSELDLTGNKALETAHDITKTTLQQMLLSVEAISKGNP